MKVIVLCGGPSAEFLVSLSTAEGILENIDKKYKVSVFYMGKDYKAVLFKPEGKRDTFPVPKNDFLNELSKVDKKSVIINAMHGEFGEDGVIQSILDVLGLKYTGSGVRGSVLCMNKPAAFSIVSNKVDVKIPKIYSIERIQSAKKKKFHFPLVVKPIDMGSSIGVEIVESEKDFIETMEKLKEEFSGVDYIFEEYINNSVEISCGCLQKKNGEFIKLPPIEICPKISNFYDYRSKYEKGGSDHFIPPKSIDKKLQERFSTLACEIHRVLDCKTYSRSDFLVRNEEIYFLETNSLPGMTSTSLIPEEARAIGMEYPEFLDFIIKNT